MAPKPGNSSTKRMQAFRVARVRPNQSFQPTSEWSPLGDTLARYRNFFTLFDDFSGYVDFIMLQDLVTDECSAVTFFMLFDDFKTPSVPKERHLQGVPTPQHRVHRG